MTNEELATLIQRGEDLEENQALLWEAVRPFVWKLAKTYKHHADPEDLVQESYFALMAAVKHFDPYRGMKFLTYASPAIQRGMVRYIVEWRGGFRLPEWRAARAGRYRRAFSDFQRDHGREPSDLELCQILNMSLPALADTKIDSYRLYCLSLDAPTSEDPDAATLADLIPDSADQYTEADEEEDRRRLSSELWELIDSLPREQAAAIHCRYEEGLTRVDTAASLGVSPTTARRLEHKAICALRGSRRGQNLINYLNTTYSRALHGRDSTADTAINNIEHGREYAQLIESQRAFYAGILQKGTTNTT